MHVLMLDQNASEDGEAANYQLSCKSPFLLTLQCCSPAVILHVSSLTAADWSTACMLKDVQTMCLV